MLLTIATTHRPATDLGYLLHKNPARPGMQHFDLSFGRARVFYPEANEERCTAALLLDVDPIALVRRPKREAAPVAHDHYVNDRPYVASSFLSVAIAAVYGSALAGRSRERPELAETRLPLTARLAAVPTRGGVGDSRRLFEPLGYEVAVEGHPLDPAIPDWGASPYWTLELRATKRLRDLLAHLYVLIPALDEQKHYWVGDDEVAKLLKHGEGWLADHPAREMIATRYLKRRRLLVEDALARLADEGATDPDGAAASLAAGREIAGEERGGLRELRLRAVRDALEAAGARRVLDLGCGEGRLLGLLAEESTFAQIVGVDASVRALEAARRRVVERLPERQRERVTLLHGALTYRDRRLAGFDAAAAVEVIEHLDPGRLAAFARAVFGAARPARVVVTTPNRDHNALFPDLAPGEFRHPDHRFEWGRAEFRAWAEEVGERFGYVVRIAPIGDEDAALGAPTQMAVFTRSAPEFS